MFKKLHTTLRFRPPLYLDQAVRSTQMKGIYVLIIENHANIKLEIGKLGLLRFKRGFYAYVGSALSGLEQRIGRHRRAVGTVKKVHWHIDYLLAAPTVELKEVVFAETDERKECEIAANMRMHLDALPHFGCSDCSCHSHLFFAPRFTELKEQVYNSFQAVKEPFRTTIINPV
ncbi:MAG: GIY-YIG nuclease family protein [Methanophagales archaeon ANME-1-THS]|nr:MAG: GIY-YIG nuclease family protein [Methanophagales archaeon ANME-1-THS]